MISVDLEMPGPPRFRTLEAVQKALASGSLDMSSIDDRARSILKFVKTVGNFESPKEAPETAFNNPLHRRLIRDAGADSIVLLKNEGGILPLQTTSLSSIAVLGQAKTCFSNGGGSANLNAHYKITPYDALKSAVGETVELRYALGMYTLFCLPSHTQRPACQRNHTDLMAYSRRPYSSKASLLDCRCDGPQWPARLDHVGICDQGQEPLG